MSISICENMDCMEAMKGFPDKYFELAVVDPPYGLGGRVTEGGNTNSQSRKFRDKYRQQNWDNAPKSDYFIELMRVSTNQIICGGNYFKLPPTRCFVFWDKKQRMPTFSDGEFIWTSFDRPAKIFEEQSTDLQRFHPTQKPIALYKWLLTNYAKPGDKILDTHLGSGSSRIAAYDMGFDFWGYEIDADYFAAMEARFQAHISKPVLFAPEQMYNFEQKKLFEE